MDHARCVKHCTVNTCLEMQGESFDQEDDVGERKMGDPRLGEQGEVVVGVAAWRFGVDEICGEKTHCYITGRMQVLVLEVPV